MNTNSPYSIFETGQGGAFLTFDLDAERVALPYLSLNKLIFGRGDRITLEFTDAQVDILGEEMAELFTLLARAKVEMVRQGSHAKTTVREIRLSSAPSA